MACINKVLAFPSSEDQLTMQVAIETFLHCRTGKARDLMLRTIRTVLDEYRISRFCFTDYAVYATKEYPWALVRAKNEIIGSDCPGCGANIYYFRGGVQILNIKEQPGRHFVTYGCRCGKIFGKWEEILK